MSTSAPPPSAPRAARWLRCIALSGLVALCALPSESFSPQQFVTTHRMMDDSWRLALPDALRHGQVSGRDLTFNYGPTYQLLHALGLWVPACDAPSLMRFHGVLEALLIVGGCWCLTTGTSTSPQVRSVFFLAWVVILAAPGDFRAAWFKPMGGLLPVAWGAGWLASARENRGAGKIWPWRTIAAWGLGPAAMSTYSFEMGPLTLAAEWLAAAAILVCSRGLPSGDRRRLRVDAAISALSAFTASLALVGAVLLYPPTRNCLLENVSLVVSYPKSWAAGGRPQDLALLCLPVPVALLALFCATMGWKHERTCAEIVHCDTKAWLRLIGAACYSVILVRYGLTRSDIFHVWRAVAPCLFVGAVMLPCMLWNFRPVSGPASGDAGDRDSGAAPAWPRYLAWGLPAALLLPWVFTHTFSVGWKIRALQLARLSPAPARFVAIDPAVESAVKRAAPLPGDDLIVWPYGALINVLAGKRNPIPTIHPIESHNATLAEHTLNHLRQTPDAPVLLFTAGIDPDGVSNVTRTAPIFRYLLEHYQLQLPVESGHALLLPRPAAARWIEREVSIDPAAFQPGEGRGVVISLPTDACRASDLLLLKLRIERTPMFGFRKPGRALAALVLDDGERLIRPLPTPTDGEPYELLLTGMELNDPLLLAAFASDRGRLVSRERLQEIQIAWTPLDALSARPAEMEVLGLRVLEPADAARTRAIHEIDLNQRRHTGVWRQFFNQSPPR